MIPQAITSRGGAFNPRTILAAALCLMGVSLAALSFGAPSFAKGKGLTSSASVVSPSQAPIGAWSVVDSPNVTRQQLSAVSCASASDCWAVGHYYNTSGFALTLIEHWNGNSWTIVPSPNVAFYSNHLTGVACNSTADCWAVGLSDYTESRTLIEHWDGSAWAIVASPNPSNNQNELYGVTCISTSDCWAVGSSAAQTLVEHWDGGVWSVVSSPNPGPQIQAFLYGVTCVSSSDCWAVGRSGGGGGGGALYLQTFIVHWNGAAWSSAASPSTSATRDNVLTSVACDSSSGCWAVGYYEGGFDANENSIYQTLIERWDGATWSIVSSPNASHDRSNILNSITCPSASQCWAVGAYADGTSAPSLILQWNGVIWSIVPDPISMPHAAFLNGVACVSNSSCRAVGTRDEGQTLTEHLDGASWSAVNSPNAIGGGWETYFNGVACNSASDCWAVGDARFGSEFRDHALIEHWNGNSWSIIQAPYSPDDQVLYDVTCVSGSDCWAVGDSYDFYADFDRSLVLHWDGNSWSNVASPNVAGAFYNFLFGVKCTSASDCWAVGGYYNGIGRTLTEHWDGTSWTIVSSPNGTAFSNGLLDVDCNSATDCWAVGHANSDNTTQTLAEHWDGTAWSVVVAPSPSQGNFLDAIECVSPGDCWAVGFQSNGSPSQTLAEHWNGSSWSIVPLPISPSTWSALGDVACTSTNDCWAVGNIRPIINEDPLAAHWDGSSWSVVYPPNRPNRPNDLYAVTCLSAARCWAVGGYSPGGGSTLTEQFTALQITSASRSNGHFSLTGLTVPNASVNIQASPDLIAPFVTIDTVTADANGAFNYLDVNSSSFQKRFYRAAFP
jgi:hypothetical protein